MVTFIGVLAVAVIAWVVAIYNRLVRLRNQVRAGWSDIDVQLTRRHDLVPMLVEAVKAYASHEKTLLESVAQLRAQALATAQPSRLAAVEGELEQALGRVIALREAYPELKASDNFLKLQTDLVEVEDHLQYARRFYNGAVRGYNDGIQKFPDVLIARGFGFGNAEFYRAADGERAAPTLEIE